MPERYSSDQNYFRQKCGSLPAETPYPPNQEYPNNECFLLRFLEIFLRQKTTLLYILKLIDLPARQTVRATNVYIPHSLRDESKNHIWAQPESGALNQEPEEIEGVLHRFHGKMLPGASTPIWHVCSRRPVEHSHLFHISTSERASLTPLSGAPRIRWPADEPHFPDLPQAGRHPAESSEPEI